VTEITIRPTSKFIKAGATCAGLVVLGLEVACWRQWGVDWQMLLPPVLLLWPAARAVRRQLTKVIISGDRLRYETGLISKSIRTIQLSRIQDIRVDQRLIQRLLQVGDVSVETSGEASRLTLFNVDHPQTLVDDLLNRSRLYASGGPPAPGTS
jgi:uncharacterized membrane protein YdbT with pleckstrin-like domain